MLRMNRITKWGDLFSELKDIRASLAGGGTPNFNLLRRSLVGWRREEVEPGLRRVGADIVRLRGEELDRFEAELIAAHDAIREEGDPELSLGHVKAAITMANTYFLQRKTDRELRAMAYGVERGSPLVRSMEEAVWMEMVRRSLVRKGIPAPRSSDLEVVTRRLLERYRLERRDAAIESLVMAEAEKVKGYVTAALARPSNAPLP